jgi:hypothetical protein
MSITLPDLSAIVDWFKSRLRPENEAIGNGASDWTVTAEYVPQVKVGETLAWGAMCSPGDKNKYLTKEDIAEKRAHILITEPKNENDIVEIWTTFRHEFGHIIDSMVAPIEAIDRKAAENAQHSWDNFLKLLTPEESALFARIKNTETARAYRAETTAMPDAPTEEKDKKPDKAAPAMQEGADMSVEEIKKALAEARLAGDQPKVLELVDKLLVTHMAAPAPASVPLPPVEPPTMGMKPEEAYARGKKEAEAAAEAKAVKAYAESLEGLTPEQKIEVADAPSMARAQRLVKSYSRQTQGATLGALPGKIPGKTADADETPFARMMKGPTDPMVREALGLGNALPGARGIGTAPAHILTLSFHEQAQEFQTKNRAKMAKAREAA